MLEQLMEQLQPDLLKDLGSLSKDELNYLYNLGVKQFQIGNYNKALPMFQFVSACDTANPAYCKALAGCFHAMKDYMNAFFSYQFAYVLDMKQNSDCLFYSGVCMFEAKQLENAQKYFEDFINSESPQSELLAKAKLYMKAITVQNEKSTSH